uniref:Uncharacterized protein n=1 Tax=Pyxicephalus adspersus TaxID=30357 RepID=A0AAV2ZTB8_PYXAD|nr:TPA: hypothetical protein GDO54_004496 [Pyxicephalus adspersus]
MSWDVPLWKFPRRFIHSCSSCFSMLGVRSPSFTNLEVRDSLCVSKFIAVRLPTLSLLCPVLELSFAGVSGGKPAPSTTGRIGTASDALMSLVML